ncbi:MULTISPECIES: hypothetical protein [unclassified Pedobacter]|uniref:hypothetical protein n=1 Tax=unclassified Pedobacter TaxID=2628915 RepID=UPI001E4244B0|nr:MULTISPECIES: hypothetical protein [unclassified Pedobacter]
MNNLFLRNQLCVPVNGYNRAIIYDILRKDYFLIPKEHYDLLDTNDFIQFDKIKDVAERDELIDFLMKEEIIFRLSNKEQKKHFTILDKNFETPNRVTNVIIHSNIDSNFLNLIKVEYLLNLSIISENIDENLFSILEKVSQLEIDSIYLYIENINIENLEAYKKQIAKYSIIFSVNFFNSKNVVEKTQLSQNIYYNFYEEEFSTYKRNLSIDKLVINTEHFLESNNFHSYYFGKIYIDETGNIKNGLNNLESFGSIKSMTLTQFLEIISSSKYNELGEIKKHQMLVCKDCEFRYMCVDSRVPSKGAEHWFHHSECTYNPYISKWNNEEGYLNLKDSGVTISESGCTINEEKLSENFDRIWNT